MAATLLPLESSSIQLRDAIEYSATGVVKKTLVKDNNCQYNLLCLAAGLEISEHNSARNATINVVEGKGILTLEGKDIVLESGVFVFMPARAPHALKAESNLAFVLTFSEGN
ncbi:cupin domain-containing protein [Tychonema sp. LEGE 07203]|uniref:cupin domain-containing protein n=1 Tax=Tychonema sp. LEGE 07203 TaxID=1828671 RepID=UPI0018823C45|nr:cupin domain-containing protein [Tychonema sp. LEGE 07203]MBE9094832.1 cupin domain-containing protein [Tychonema sp. LEGE 07203]